MTRVTLEQWRMFLAVAEHGGFNQAAKAIHKSQSSIHTGVNKIEHTLNIKLFQVEGRKTLPTQAGKMMLRRCDYLLGEALKIEQVGLAMGEGVESSLKVAVDEVFPKSMLYQALDVTSLQFSMLNIELMESILTGSTELLTHSQVDIAVSPYPLGDGLNEALCQVEFVAVAHPHHGLHQLERDLTLEDLKSHRQIVVRDSAHFNRHDDGWLVADQRWTVGHMATSIDMICHGLGFAWLPANAIVSQLAKGQLQPLKLPQGGKRHTQLYLICNDEDKLGPAAKTLIKHLRLICHSPG